MDIEYYVPDWNTPATSLAAAYDERASITPLATNAASGEGAWVTYEELAARYDVGGDRYGSDATDEGHTANGNLFRDVTGVRWTYYDVPAVARANNSGADVVAFPLDDVSLLGVARYQDTRQDSTAVSHAGGEQENLWKPYGSVDVGFTHSDNQATVLDFVDVAASNGSGTTVLAANDPVTHGTLLTKQDEAKKKVTTVWRRTPVMRFQSQVFQTEAQAAASYDPEATQKTGYVAGERFWYKNTLKNVPKRTNAGITKLEGELYNPVFYELIPTEYLKNEADGALDAQYLADHIQVKWLENRTDMTDPNNPVTVKDKDVYNARTHGMKLIVVPVDSYEMPDYGGAMIYDNGFSNVFGGHGDYFADMDPRAAGVSRDTEFTLFKIAWIADDEALPAGAAEVTRSMSSVPAPGAGAQTGSIIDDGLAYDRPVDLVQAGSTRMEVGDVIELYFDVYASVDNLPQVYQRNNITGAQDLTGGGTAGLEPAYFPRVGEYYYADWHPNYGSNWPGHVSPLGGTGSGAWNIGASYYRNYNLNTPGASYHMQHVGESQAAWQVVTNDVLMDMDYLMLDSAFSGDKPENTDTWEMFDGSYTYIPGEGLSYGHYNGLDVNGWGTNGMTPYEDGYLRTANGNADSYKAGYLLDTDMKVSNNRQVVRYTPRPRQSTKDEAASELPNDVHYLWWYYGHNDFNTGYQAQIAENNLENGAGALRNADRYVRDWYHYVTKARTLGSASLDTVPGTDGETGEPIEVPTGTRWHSSTPLVWSETRLHMQKAWLATSSRFISGSLATEGSGVSNYETQRFYQTEDTYAGWRTANYDYADEYRQAHRGVLRGQYTTALQYNQDFISELTAYNYGDRNLDGVEFTYVMPRGVEPMLDGSITVVPGPGEDLDADEVSYSGQVSLTVNAEGLEDPIIVDVVSATGTVVVENFKLTPNKKMTLGGDDMELPQGDYWIVVKSVGTTPEGLPFEEGSYTYRVLVDGKVEERTTSFKPLSFHIVAHDAMAEKNPSFTTGENNEQIPTGITVDVSGALKAEKRKVYAEDGQPVRLTKLEGVPSETDTVVTIGTKTYVKDPNGKYVTCAEDGRFVEIDDYDAAVPSQVSGELTLNRIEKESAVSVTVNAEGASPDFPAKAQIVAMEEKRETRPVLGEDGKPVVGEDGEALTEEVVTYEETGEVVAEVEIVANAPAVIATLPRGHYGLKFTASPQMPPEAGQGGLGYTLPSEVQHFYVVGLGDAVELAPYTLEHVWDASPVQVTVDAPYADAGAPTFVIIRNENGDVIDGATGLPVLPAEGEDAVDEEPYRIAVAPHGTTQLPAPLPRGSYTVALVQAPVVSYTYTVVEQDGSGANVTVEKTGTWEYRAPKDAVPITADGHGAVIEVPLPCELGDAPSVVAGTSVVRALIGAEGAGTDAEAKYRLVSVAVTGEGDDAVESETTVAENQVVSLNHPVLLRNLEPGTYRLYFTESPLLPDGGTFALPAAPVEFTVPEGGTHVDVATTLEPGANPSPVTVTVGAAPSGAAFPVGATFTFHVEDAEGNRVPINDASGTPADERTAGVSEEMVLGSLAAGAYTLVIDEQSWSGAPYLWSTALTVNGTAAPVRQAIDVRAAAEPAAAGFGGVYT